MDAGPDRRAYRPLGCGTARNVGRWRADLGEVLHRDFNRQRQRLELPGVHDRDRPPGDGRLLRSELLVEGVAARRSAPLAPPALGARAPATGEVASGSRSTDPPRNRATSSSGRWVADRPMRCMGSCDERLEPLQRECQVRAALRGHERVDLVHNHGADRSQRLSRLRREHQEQRLGRRDRGCPAGSRWNRVRSPAGVSPVRTADGGHDERLAAPPAPIRDSGDGGAQVALDVHGERLQGRDVEHATPGARIRDRREHEPIDRPEEGRQRLAAPGRREDERALATRDCGPAARLRGGRRIERRREPLPHRAVKRSERIRCASGRHASDSTGAPRRQLHGSRRGGEPRDESRYNRGGTHTRITGKTQGDQQSWETQARD